MTDKERFDREKWETDYIASFAKEAHYRKKGERSYFNGFEIEYTGKRHFEFACEWEEYTYLEGKNKGKTGLSWTMYYDCINLNESSRKYRESQELSRKLYEKTADSLK